MGPDRMRVGGAEDIVYSRGSDPPLLVGRRMARRGGPLVARISS
jgi:hypothetical protein